MRMLLDYNGGVCEVVTGVTVGEYYSTFLKVCHSILPEIIVWPVLTSPGYAMRCVTSAV